ncbi:hypothetical protein ACPCSK_34420 [Streptomyces griseoincarnatus]
MTLTEVQAAISSLRSELAAGTWSPSAAEHDAAHEAVLQSVTIDVTPAEAITLGIWAAGTEGATEVPLGDGGSRLTHLMKQCADILSEAGFDTSAEGKQLDRELHQLLHEVDDRRPRPRVLERFRRHRSPQN